jgi:hypothetical protein
MTNGEVSRPRQALSMGPILRDACILPWNHRHHFGRLLIIPVVLTTLMSIAESYWLEGKQLSTVALIGSLLFLPDFLIFTFFAVSCHRSILIGENSVSRFGVPRWSMRETRFYLWILGIYILGSFTVILFGGSIGVITGWIAGLRANGLQNMTAVLQHPAFFYIVMALLSVPFMYVVGRLSLLLPAVAVDLRPSIKSAWSQSTGNGWRVAVLVGGIPIMFIVLQVLFEFAIQWLTGVSSKEEAIQWLGAYSIVTSGLYALLRYNLAIVEVAILSLTFKELSGWQPHE